MTNQTIEIEALFMSIGDGAITTDELGRITRVNPMAIRHLGYKQADLIGEIFTKKLIATDFEGGPINFIDRPIAKALLTGEPVTDSIMMIRKDGRKLPVSLTISPILYQGRSIGAIEVFRDITFELEVDRLKSEFISLASHQLRTPLSAIKTYSHMLAEGYMGELNKDQKKSLRTIINATDRMNTLISHLLSISRFENGTIETKPNTFELKTLAEESINDVSVMAYSKSIKLKLSLKGTTDTTLTTDALMVKEVVINLLSNAIKYTPDKGTVELIIKPRLKDIIIEVKDDGWGIPSSDQDQIFTKFYRAQNIARRETDGTGLGLYLVKGLLNSLGGSIWFESIENKGTSFYIKLPRM
jgi:PAS domain S-box-containing protein